MRVAIIGTGFIGTTLGRPLQAAGHEVVYGSRRTDHELADLPGRLAPVGDAIASSDAILLAVPAAAVEALGHEHADALAGMLVVDATNRMGEPVANSRAALPSTVRYARAFNTLGGETLADPVFPGGTADLFFSAPPGDRDVVEELVRGVGLVPVYLGADREDLVDALFTLWIQLAVVQGRGRHLGLKVLEDR